MATERRATDSHAAVSVLESADFVRIVTRADGDGLAAAGLLARELSRREMPFQVSVGTTIADRTERVQAGKAGDDGSVTIAIGALESIGDGASASDARTDTRTISLERTDRPATLESADLLGDLGSEPDLKLTLAGTLAAGIEPGAGETEWLLERALDGTVLERRPGVSVPTTDPVDGLAHSMACLAPWSGDTDATEAALESVPTALEHPADLSVDDHRAIGSLVALDAVGHDEAVDAAGTAIGRFLRPYELPDGPFTTLGGFAEVLEATAQVEPGTGVALAMGHSAREPALETWRTCGRQVHTAIDSATTSRYGGLFALDCADHASTERPLPVRSIARLVAAYRSPEPAVLAVGPQSAALAVRESRPLEETIDAVATHLGTGTQYDLGQQWCSLRFDEQTDTGRVIDTVRDHL
ncbi:exonuclease [Halobacteria archaeon AArc-curdl1]|uniref:Exonuclease n=1 Tax=Natronosalvus hydrolyticus TaxID=2979988 RepID=A0AAP3E4S9_9EURY|nr:exonuclease [Halobacteria archaeon AArc-curdl1]